MIDLYFWSTPNGYKVSILLEELGWGYNVIPVHIGKGEQFKPEFLKISPNNKIPAIVDDNGPGGVPLALFESGAIMLYLAEKAGWQFLPQDTVGRFRVTEWLMFQMGGVGPMLGQAHHFRKYAPEQIEYAIDRYTQEARRIYGVLDRRLAETRYLAGDGYSIADMATFPWIRPHNWQGQALEDFPSLHRWYREMKARPAVQRGVDVLKEKIDRSGKPPSGERWNNLFGGKQFDGQQRAAEGKTHDQ
jgi:GST-like protein